MDSDQKLCRSIQSSSLTEWVIVNKDLFDYDITERCSNGKTVCSNTNFQKKSSRQDGLHPHCRTCLKQ